MLIVGAVLSVIPGLFPFESEFETPALPHLKLNPDDRIMIMAPHPDDEIIGCGGIIQKAQALNIPTKIVFLTYGDFNEWSFLLYKDQPVLTPKGVEGMGLVRRAESVAADTLLGLLTDDLIFLGYPDSGTLAILISHWNDRPPYRSILTHANSVPYQNAFRPLAPYKGEEILRDLKTVIEKFKPTKIFLSHPADRHPDHQALYLFTKIALWELDIQPMPDIYPYLVHYKKWPNPKGYKPHQALIPPWKSLHGLWWFSAELTEAEILRKYEALQLIKTQLKSNPKYIKSFIKTNELFGDFPAITLSATGNHTEFSDLSEDESNGNFFQPIDIEQAKLIGFVQRKIELVDDMLEIKILLTKPLFSNVGITLYLFGYKKGVPFENMPKLRLRIGKKNVRITNQTQKMSSHSVTVSRAPKEITVKVPLNILDNPDYLLTGTRAYLGQVPLDWTSWRTLYLNNINHAGDKQI